MDGAQVVATVAGRAITVAALEERLAEARRGPRGRHLPPDGPGMADHRRWLVHQLVRDALIAHEAGERGLRGRVDVVAAVTADVTVDESDVRAYYERNVDRYERPETRRIRYRIVTESDQPFDDAAGSATDLEVHRGELAGPIEAAIFSALVGGLVGPLAWRDRWFVGRLEAISPAGVVGYEQVRADVEAELLEAARLRAFDAWLDGRRGVLAVLAPGYEHPGDPVHGFPTHRH
ncbi:MAG: peptidylprolyl isomerase [Chloroflexota bacterium]